MLITQYEGADKIDAQVIVNLVIKETDFLFEDIKRGYRAGVERYGVLVTYLYIFADTDINIDGIYTFQEKLSLYKQLQGE